MRTVYVATERSSLRLALRHLLSRQGLEHEFLDRGSLDAAAARRPEALWLLDAALRPQAPTGAELDIVWLLPEGEEGVESLGIAPADLIRWPGQLEELGSRLGALLRAPAKTAEQPDEPRTAAVLPLRQLPEEPRPHRSSAWAAVETRILRLAPHDLPVLILGESGTGKELVARGLHESSPRDGEPFVAVHCGAIPGELLESELFGHERGAFTDAVGRRIGSFEAAGRGTLLLDEIGEMPLSMQTKLLRVLQERSIRRVGGERELPVHARILAATHRNLRQMVHEGAFRQDLLHRLEVGVLELPPLRERPEDLRLLTELFLRRIADRTGRELEGIDAEGWDKLSRHDWPGNVRELENLLQRAVLLSERELLGAADLPLEPAAPPESELIVALRRRMQAGQEGSEALQALEAELRVAAENLGITPVRPPSQPRQN